MENWITMIAFLVIWDTRIIWDLIYSSSEFELEPSSEEVPPVPAVDRGGNGGDNAPATNSHLTLVGRWAIPHSDQDPT